MSRSTKETSGLRIHNPETSEVGQDTFGAPFTDWDCGTALLDSPSTDTAVMESPHHLERSVCRALRHQSKLRFSSLVVRRTQAGVLLEGVVEQDAGAPNVADIVRAFGVNRVDNRLVMR